MYWYFSQFNHFTYKILKMITFLRGVPIQINNENLTS